MMPIIRPSVPVRPRLRRLRRLDRGPRCRSSPRAARTGGESDDLVVVRRRPQHRNVARPDHHPRYQPDRAGGVEQGLAASPHYRSTYTGPDTITTGFASLKQLKAAGDDEGYLSFGLGLDHRAGFRVVTLTNPSRIAIDIARA